MSALYPPIYKGATAGLPGIFGLVPAAAAGDQAKFFRADGTWVAVAGGGDMLAANNLSDVVSVATSRTNLGLGTGNNVVFATVADQSGVIGRRIADLITQNSHGFAVGNVLYSANGTWTKAKADALSTTYALGVVESVTTNTFVLVYQGPITLSGLTVSTLYYLSDATGGATTTTAPTTTTSFVLPVIRTGTATQAYVVIGQPASLAKINLTTDITGTLPVANGGTGITSFGTGVATWLGTPSSANLAAAITDETGTGALVFANTPTLVSPILGTPTSGTLSACTGLPISTGVSGLGASVATALAVATNSAGGFSPIDGTATLTNKRITARVTTITSNATPTVNTDSCDCVTITALAAAITSMTTNLSGTPSNFDQLEYRILDNGTVRAITWGTSFVAGPTALPTTTVQSKALHVWFEYDSVQAKWVCLSSGSDA